MVALEYLTLAYAKITRTNRYRPEIVWSRHSYTHNVFRVYEFLFGRKIGIRCEMTRYVEKERGKHQREIVYLHTFEAVVAHIEGMIRLAWRDVKKLQHVRVYVPQLAAPAGFPLPNSPFLFAIAFDQYTYNTQDTTTSLTTALTLTGSQLAIITGQFVGSDGNNCAGTWNTSENLTVDQQISPAEANRRWGILHVLNATSGTHNLVLTTGSSTTIRAFASSFSGCLTTGGADASSSGTRGSGGTSWSPATTSTVDNAVLVSGMRADGANVTSISGGGTQMGTLGVAGFSWGYEVCGAAGSQSLTFNYDGTSTGAETQCSVILKPAIAVGPSGVKTFEGVTQSTGVKTYMGVAVASVKSVNGIT